ncbi:MAG: hypothetical protein ABSF97_00615 [Candidatus Sulfotelmatobacter sp.]|jgi:hypothetical protein
MRAVAVAFVLLIVSSLSSASSSYVVPTTTLAAQTSNNTSTANSFKSLPNGDLGAGNISKLDVHSLLYPGATTKIYAHMVLWFGQSNHMNIGYSETNPAQVQSQIDDMVSRGIDGVIIDWYGPGNSIDQATQLVMAAAENHPGFTFAIMIDQGAIEWYSCHGCSPQQALVNDLQYIERTYFPSPAYMKINGQPMVTNFNVSLSYPSVNWENANSALNTHPTFLFQNNDGFTQQLSDGSYSWVMPTAADYGLDYMASFYDVANSFPKEQTVGATYKGFNDMFASWGSNRIMGQQCGQTWLQTFAKLNSMYNSGHPLPDLQLVTWNDYEEATELESGIDNCLTVSGSVSGNTLQWSVTGNENTVDHYTVYISDDGRSLMPLTDIASGIGSLNLCAFPIPNGKYQLFVQAIGKPSLTNQISGAENYTATCESSTPTPTPTPTPPTPTVSLKASPGSLTIQAGLSGTLTVSAIPQAGTFNNPISLSCGSLPSNLSCTFYPATVTPGSRTATSTLVISDTSLSARVNPPNGHNALPFSAGWMLPFGLAGFFFLGQGNRKRGVQALAFCALLGMGMATTACAGYSTGAKTATSSVPAVTYSMTVKGTSSAGNLSTPISVIVQ